MKEIDFLPEWYKSGKRRQVNYRVQYIILAGVFTIMMVWNYVSASSASKVRAKYLEMETRQSQSEKVSTELNEYKKDITVLREKEKLLDGIDSQIIVSNVLAEISYVVNERIVLNKIEFISENIPDKKNTEKIQQPVSVVRSSSQASGNKTVKTLGNVRFKVLISGVAAGGSDVAALLCSLEDSLYFSRVDLSFSKEAEVNKAKTGTATKQDDVRIESPAESVADEKIHVSQFEINCYLSNYTQQD
jgi:hypothetical protein